MKTLIHNSGTVWAVNFDGNGLLASGSGGMAFKIWDVSSGECVKTLNSYGVNSVHFDGNGLLATSGSGGETIKIWDVSSGACVKILNVHGNNVTSIRFFCKQFQKFLNWPDFDFY